MLEKPRIRRVWKNFSKDSCPCHLMKNAIRAYGEIRAQVERAGTPVGPNDLFIAAIAMANNMVLLTHNSEEFQHIDGLVVKDWGLG